MSRGMAKGTVTPYLVFTGVYKYDNNGFGTETLTQHTDSFHRYSAIISSWPLRCAR